MSDKINIELYTDKYFLRSYLVLKKENLNPFVRAQVFIRKGPGIVAGIDEAISFIRSHSNIEKNGGHIYSLKENSEYKSLETILIIEGYILDIIQLETIYLGIISSATTLRNDKTEINYHIIKSNMKEITLYTSDRPVVYFGARHWHYSLDSIISKAAIDGGAVGTSTDIGSQTINKEGIGTIPHVLEAIFAWRYGQKNAVLESTKAFDKWISKKVERVALVDYNNKEIEDTIEILDKLKNIKWIRIDTCGENIIQDSISFNDLKDQNGIFYPENKINNILKKYFNVPIQYSTIPKEDLNFWFGFGVTISGVYIIKKQLILQNRQDVKIMLTSGFGNLSKVIAFKRAEKILNIRLYDSLGVGGLYHSRDATMDIVFVGKDKKSMVPISKKGRTYNKNTRLHKYF